MPVFLVLRKMKQEDGEFETNLSYMRTLPHLFKRISGKVPFYFPPFMVSWFATELPVCIKASARS